MTDNNGLTEADRADIHSRLVAWFGDARQAFLTSHLAPVVDRIKVDGYIAGLAAGVEVRASEFQQAALEMARKADQAERRAEDAEAAYERLRAAADLVGHQAACLVDPCDCWMYHLAPLLEYERPEWVKVADDKRGIGGDAWQVTLYEEQHRPQASECACWPPYESCSHPPHPPCTCDGCIGAACDHQWLDRPESDTRECLVCGTEATG